MTDVQKNSSFSSELVMAPGVLAQIEKKHKREEETLLGLSLMMQQLLQSVGHAGEDEALNGSHTMQPSAFSSDPEQDPSTEPTEQALKDALVQMNTMLSQLQQQVNSTQNQELKNELTIEMNAIETAKAQLQKAEDVYANLQKIEAAIQAALLAQATQEAEEIAHIIDLFGGHANLSLLIQQEYQDIFSNWQKGTVEYTSQSGDIFHSNETVTIVDYRKLWGQFILDYLQKNYGITASGINPDNYATEGDFEKAVMTHYLGGVFEKMFSILFGGSNPVFDSLVKFFENGGLSAAQILQLLEGMMEEMIKILTLLAKAQSSDQKDGPSREMLTAVLCVMTSLVSQLKADVAEFDKGKSSSDSQVLNSLTQMAQEALKKAQQQYKEIEEEEHQKDTWGKVLDIVTTTITVVAIVAACACGQVEIAAMLTFFLIMQKTGEMDKIKAGIADFCVKNFGMSQEDANIMADVVIIVSMALLCGGASSVCSAEAAADVSAEEAETTAAEEAESQEASAQAEAQESEEVENTNQENTQEETSAENAKDKSAVQKIRDFFASLGKSANVGIFAGSQAALNTSLFQDIAISIAEHQHLSQKQKMELEITLEVLGGILCSLVGLMAADGIASNTAQTATSTHGMLMKGLSGSMLALSTVQAAAQFKLGEIEMKLSKAQKRAGKEEAITELMQRWEKVFDADMKASMKHYGKVIENHNKVDASVNSELYAGEVVFAQLLSQAV
jgi:hypothetical protein